MAEVIKDFWLGLPVGMYVILVLAFGLGVAGFIVPPLGIISGSVLKAMALILGAAWLYYVTVHLPEIIASGAKIKASYGNAQIEIGRKKEENEEEENKEQ